MNSDCDFVPLFCTISNKDDEKSLKKQKGQAFACPFCNTSF